MQKVTNLYNLYGLGHVIGQLSNHLSQKDITFNRIGMGCGLLYSHLTRMAANVPVPFESTGRVVKNFIGTLDSLKEHYGVPEKRDALIGETDHRQLLDAITQLEVQLMYELDAMPIWFVTKRRAYSIDVLINNAEEVLDSTDLPHLSKRTVTDIREAGKAMAFSLPTAVGFHSVRAVEGVARGYHEVIIGTRASGDTPLGPLTQALRTARDAQLAGRQIDKEDLLNMVIDLLTRINNVYRKPITHPDMVLELGPAMNVFDSAKCAVELMLEDTKKKHTGPVPLDFF